MKLYICHTPYHLLISITKILLIKSQDSMIVLCNDDFVGEDIIFRLRESGIVSSLLVHHDIDSFSRSFHSEKNPAKRKKILINANKVVEIEKYNASEIYIYNDDSTYGMLLNYKKIGYHLLEDGLNCFQYDSFKRSTKLSKKLYKLIQKIFNIYIGTFGDSEVMIDIEVNDSNNVHVGKAKKIIHLPRNELFGKLSDSNKAQLVTIFIGDELSVCLPISPHSALLLTQPIEIGTDVSEEEKIYIYDSICNKYSDYSMLIKVHPRERVEPYIVKFGKDKVIYNKYIPVEVFTFLPNIHFDLAITLYSTAIEGITFADENVCLGKHWLREEIQHMRGQKIDDGRNKS